MTVLVAGLVVFGFALKPGPKGRTTAAMRAVANSASMLAGVAPALYAALQAVDGVSNQQVDAAWEHATGADKTARFASAEMMPWLEWELRSYHDYALGLAPIGFAVAAAGRLRCRLPGLGLCRPHARLLGCRLQPHRRRLGSQPCLDGLTVHSRPPQGRLTPETRTNRLARRRLSSTPLKGHRRCRAPARAMLRLTPDRRHGREAPEGETSVNRRSRHLARQPGPTPTATPSTQGDGVVRHAGVDVAGTAVGDSAI